MPTHTKKAARTAARGSTESAKPEEPKRGVGRPRLEFDLAEVERLGSIGATVREMAPFLGCAVSTVADRLAQDGDFRNAYEKGLAGCKQSLRRRQLEVAQEGNPTMLIWLGKQMLEQRDKLEHTGEGGGPVVHKVEVVIVDSGNAKA